MIFLNNVFPVYNSNTDFWKSFGMKLASGGVAGAVANTVCYPFDFARTRLTSDMKAGTKQFKGSWDCISTTLRKEGIVGLYTGWTVTCIGAFVYRAGQLGCFRQIQDLNPYKNDKGTIGVVSSFLAATAARAAVLPFNYPFDTIRRIMMLESEVPISKRTYKGSWDCFTKILKTKGPAELYKGSLPELLRGIGGSLVIVGYDRIRNILHGIQ